MTGTAFILVEITFMRQFKSRCVLGVCIQISFQISALKSLCGENIL